MRTVRCLMLTLAVGLFVAMLAHAQVTVPVPVSHETVTFDATAGGVGLSAATLVVNGEQVRECSGVLEVAAIRYYIDGTAPTATSGSPLAVGQFWKLEGYTALKQFRGFRQTGTSGVMLITCSR